MEKKKKKRCDLCHKRDHYLIECLDLFEDCSKPKVCKYFCMADLCAKFLKVVKQCCKISSKETLSTTKDKLDDFQFFLEKALEYFFDLEGRRLKSCSTKEGIRQLIRSCFYLDKKLDDCFEWNESSSDDDDKITSVTLLTCQQN